MLSQMISFDSIFPASSTKTSNSKTLISITLFLIALNLEYESLFASSANCEALHIDSGSTPIPMLNVSHCLFLSLGSVLLWLTAIIPGTKPAACNPTHQTCESSTLSQMALLHSSFLVMSIGNAGIKPCFLAFGADQLDKSDNPNSDKALQSFFNWYYATYGISAMAGLTVLVYIQQNYGWKVGLGLPVALTAVATILFLLGSPWYVKMKSQKGLLTALAQVMVAAFKNRHLDSPLNKEEGNYQSNGSNLVAPTNKLRLLSVFGVLSMTTWVAIYDRIILPHMGRITNKQRLGIGLLLSCVSAAVAAIVERSRLNTATQQGLVDAGTVNMSFMWLVPQTLLNGLAQGFHIIGQNEFYYSELPKNLPSIGMALFSLGTGFGNLLGNLIVKVVVLISSTGGKESWLATNLNKGHLDYYYWLLTVLGFNLLYFLFCSWAYGPPKEESIDVESEEE